MSESGGPTRPIPCPRCGATVAPDQDWCLDCGAAARTRIATTPRWSTPVVAVTCLLALSLGGLGFAFADLTADAGRIAPATTATTPPPAAVDPAATVPPATPPATDPAAVQPTVPTTESLPALTP